jgi:hypothetical protein
MALMHPSWFLSTESNMAKQKKNGITIKKRRRNGIEMLIVPKDATPRQICRAYKEQFTAAELVKYLEETAADLEKYLQGDKSIMPAEELLAEMEQLHREETEKRQKRRSKK